jgi:hypothetical protein
MAYEWSKYPDQVPTQPGYYLTLYFNNEHQAHLFKCIYWAGRWCAWRPGAKEDPDVKGFVQDTLNPYYVPCATNANQNVTHVDLDLFPFLRKDADGT